MNDWQLTIDKKFTCKDPIFIEGLPGIGNVGKIAIDYLVDELKAKKIGSLFSYHLPNSVFVTENNLVTLPSLDIYHYVKNKQHFIFLTGDAQPALESASYTLSRAILDFLLQYGKPRIITLGGIGLEEVPEKIAVYITGNNQAFIKTFTGVKKDIYGVVGPIFGVTGLLLGLEKKIPAVALLAQTSIDPLHIGLSEAKALLHVLAKRLSLTFSYKELDKEIMFIKKVMREPDAKQYAKYAAKLKKYQDLNYIG